MAIVGNEVLHVYKLDQRVVLLVLEHLIGAVLIRGLLIL
jgi:hypothetical protein